ncbi:MAG: hypothetical protein AAFR71_16325 [Pseudomonadota bacterium]
MLVRIFLLVAMSFMTVSSHACGVDQSANRKMNADGKVCPETFINSSGPSQDEMQITIDRSYQARFGIRVPAAFDLMVPSRPDIITRVKYPDEITAVYVQVLFASFIGGLLSSLDVYPLRISEGKSITRRRTMSRLFITQIFSDLTQRFMEKEIDGVQTYDLDDHDSIVLSGSYLDPRSGPVAIRIYGVMPKSSKHGLMFFERRYLARAPNDEGFAETVVRSVQFK